VEGRDVEFEPGQVDRAGEAKVSTLRLGHDHFETTIAGSVYDGYRVRHATAERARGEHMMILRALELGEDPRR
jgi:hypothetical protein